MITLKQQVRKALSAVKDDIVYGYPRYFENLPLLAWRESLNKRHAQADGGEYLAELNYTLEIFARDSEGANEMLLAADDAMLGLGMRRENCAELYHADASLAHITARYRCLADEEGNIYQ